MIFTTKIQIGEDESRSLFAEVKYIVHFYHDKNKNGNRTCKCQIKELETKRELVSVEVACDSRDNYVKAVGRKLSLLKAYYRLRKEGYPVDSNWIASMLKQLNRQAPQGMKLAKGVSYKDKQVVEPAKIREFPRSQDTPKNTVGCWKLSYTPKSGDIISHNGTLYQFDSKCGFLPIGVKNDKNASNKKG